MKEKRIIPSVQPVTRDHKNSRTSHHPELEKAGKKKASFFGNYASRQFVRDEMIKDGLDRMDIKSEQEDDRISRDNEQTRYNF